MSASLPAHSDDDNVRSVGWPSAYAGQWHRLRTTQASRVCNGRRPGRVAGPHPIHDTRGVHLHGQAVASAIVAEGHGRRADERSGGMNRGYLGWVGKERATSRPAKTKTAVMPAQQRIGLE